MSTLTNEQVAAACAELTTNINAQRRLVASHNRWRVAPLLSAVSIVGAAAADGAAPAAGTLDIMETHLMNVLGAVEADRLSGNGTNRVWITNGGQAGDALRWVNRLRDWAAPDPA